MEITKAVIPAAGLGTRFLPFTKAMPKEMIPLLNKPALQYIIEECYASEISNIVMITNKEKQAIANHFDYDVGLETILKEREKECLLTSLYKMLKHIHFTYIRQPEPLGLGHALWLARHTIGKEYFSVLLPDDIIVGKTPALAQMIRIARQEKASVIAVQEVPAEQTSSYGVISIKKQITPNLFHVSQVVEKPSQKDAPSNLAVIGRYVLSHKIFGALEEIEADKHGELQLTDGLTQMMHNNEKVFAYKVQGTRYDIGNPLGWIKAVIGCALQDPHYAPHIRSFLEDKNALDALLFNQTKLSENLL
jgi:UTP--glucose-1-phosphate uridylyltransferase